MHIASPLSIDIWLNPLYSYIERVAFLSRLFSTQNPYKNAVIHGELMMFDMEHDILFRICSRRTKNKYTICFERYIKILNHNKFICVCSWIDSVFIRILCCARKTTIVILLFVGFRRKYYHSVNVWATY